jgi:hypothetical protein
VALVHFKKWQLLFLADFAHFGKAARMEGAAGWRVDGAGGGFAQCELFSPEKHTKCPH